MLTIFIILITITFLVRLSQSWHAYDPDKLKFQEDSHSLNSTPSSYDCSQYNGTEIPEYIQFGNKYKLWPDLIKKENIPSSKSLYGFREAIDKIWKNQHPINCNTAKYIISNGWGGGFGSAIHVESSMFSLALQLKRVYIQNPFGPINDERANHMWHINNSYCQGRNKSTLECYYEPWSNCTINDVFGKSFITPKHLNNLKINIRIFSMNSNGNLIISPKYLHKINQMKVFLLDHAGRSSIIRFIPDILKPIVQCSPMASSKEYYWWRAITATYFLRPNNNTLEYLSRFHSEMNVLPFKNYSDVLENMLNRSMLFSIDSIKRKIPVFIGTEDNQVLEDAKRWADNSPNFRVIYTNLFDRSIITASLNATAKKEEMKTKMNVQKTILLNNISNRNNSIKNHVYHNFEIHHDLEYISMLLNLEYSLQCDLYICTLASNWCRLVDELRTTIGGKANKLFVDLSKETCFNPPCYDSNIWNLGW
eukprot:gene1847-3587_t